MLHHAKRTVMPSFLRGGKRYTVRTIGSREQTKFAKLCRGDPFGVSAKSTCGFSKFCEKPSVPFRDGRGGKFKQCFSLPVDQFINRHLKNFPELSEHFNVRLCSPLLPICIATFNNAQFIRHLLLRKFTISSTHLQILTEKFIHTKNFM